MSNHPTPDWDPRDISVASNQRHAYDEMREHCPVAYSDFLSWSLFRHQDVVNVVNDPETYSSVSKHRAVPNGMDPPEHTLYKGVLEPYFQPEQMASFEPICRAIVVDLLPALLVRENVEFVGEFAQPFAFRSLCRFLGWSPDIWDRLVGWTHGNQEVAFSQNREVGVALAREFTGYVMQELQTRRQAGADAKDDLTSSLMQTPVEGTPFSDEDIVSLLRNWTAGHGTVVAGLSILAHYIACHSDAQQQLRGDPTLLPAAIDEILRADGPLVINRRTTTREVEIDSRKIGADEKVSVNWIAANRDARAFDDPYEVRFDRDPAANLLFGAGIHYCLGAPLARFEMRVAMEELLVRTITIEPSDTQIPERDVYPSNGFRIMPVRLR